MKFILIFLILPWTANAAVLYYSDSDATMFKEEKLYSTGISVHERKIWVHLSSEHISCETQVQSIEEAKWLKEQAFIKGVWIQCHGPYTQPNNLDSIYVAATGYSVGQHAPDAPKDRYIFPD